VNPVPTITPPLSPASAAAGGAAFTLTVNGTNFALGAVVKFNGNARMTTFVSTTQVTASILASDIAAAGSFPVTVTNSGPGGGVSNAVTFTVFAAPTVSKAFNPTTIQAGGASTVTVT